MDQTAIFGPVFAMMLLTVAVWIYMYSKRIPFIRSLDIGPNELTPGELARRSPPSVATPSDNLRNLFELPVLFYALALYLHAVAAVDALYVGAAWLFVLFRVAHSVVHCTVNIVLLRFGLYAVSSICLFFMIFRAAIAFFFD